MHDRLKEIEIRYGYNNPNGDFFYEAIVHSEKVQLVKDVALLISDARQCKAEIKVLEKLIDDWRATCVTEQTIGMEWKERALKTTKRKLHYQGCAIKAEAENKELQAVFDLQETRTKKAEKMWQEATGKRHILPDLGVLLDWLMGEVEQCREKVELLKSTHIALVKAQTNVQGREIVRQRHHRKWAMHELYMMRSVAEQCDEDCKYHYEQSEKYKAEVGRLKSLLSHHGISF